MDGSDREGLEEAKREDKRRNQRISLLSRMYKVQSSLFGQWRCLITYYGCLAWSRALSKEILRSLEVELSDEVKDQRER